MKNVNDYIVVLKNAMTPALCDAILEEFSAEEEWIKTIVSRDGGTVNDHIRSAETVKISYPHVIEENPKVRQKIDRYVFSSAGAVIKRYKDKFPLCLIEEDSGYELLRYKEGHFYTQHTDSFKGGQRAISCSFALNDDYEGGEWGFFDREVVIKAPKGSAILFPSNFMYPHEIMPVTKGIRYSIVTWFV
jgi:Rps23 Pro-64 3,4-dihydroxylase Tpa1-like proline 4-hydroxylase